MIPAIGNHLWQSTAFAGGAALLAWALRKNRAGIRYWIWMAASLKFLVPFALLVGLGGHAPVAIRPNPAIVPARVAIAIEDAGQPFTTAAAHTDSLPGILFALWACGLVAVVVRWATNWRRARKDLARQVEPAVFGIFRPVLVLPPGISERLTPAQLEAIVAHEECHIRRRDNLLAAIHMAVESVFWFHPLVWWIGARLVAERENACDEEVLQMGNDPQSYAEGVLNVCKFYLESRLACAAGVTGSDLRRRIEAIMTNRISRRLTGGRKLALAVAGTLALAGPVLIGVARPQSNADTFEVASVKPGNPGDPHALLDVTPGGGVRILNGTARSIIMFAYNVRPFQVSGGPGWLDSDRFEIIGKPPASSSGTRISPAEVDAARRRLQALLADRFHLTIHRDSKEGPVYALVVAKGGPKLVESSEGFGINHPKPGLLFGQKAGMDNLARVLSMILQRPVLDQTGLTATYAFRLEWTPDLDSPEAGRPGPPGDDASPDSKPPEPAGETILSALQAQLGLKLEARRGPIDTLFIDHVEKPEAQ